MQLNRIDMRPINRRFAAGGGHPAAGNGHLAAGGGQEFEISSQEVQEILDKPPTRLIGWGSAVIGCIILLNMILLITIRINGKSLATEILTRIMHRG